MSTTLIVVIVVIAVLVLAAVAWGMTAGRAKRMQQKRVVAQAHREQANVAARQAEKARLEAKEQSDRAAAQQAEADWLRSHADEIDPDATRDEERVS
ncbi:MAG TPA: hypothetical protein VGU02_05390 [Gaiellaceae bacterium]|nr:hypothetical protein [Gaiellaceae bacterium]